LIGLEPQKSRRLGNPLFKSPGLDVHQLMKHTQIFGEWLQNSNIWFGTEKECSKLLISWLVVLTILKNMKVNGKDDIPCTTENNPNVPNHQPVCLLVILMRSYTAFRGFPP
jgi:hypothetical protein